MVTQHQNQEHGEQNEGLTRRRFIGATTAAAAGIYGILLHRKAPAFAATREITMLSWNHYVPRADVVFREQAEAFPGGRGRTAAVAGSCAPRSPCEDRLPARTA